MSGIFGFIDPTRHPSDLLSVARMASAMSAWGVDGIRWQALGPAVFGQAVTFDTPEAGGESLPRIDPRSGLLFTAEGRLDCRKELCESLGMVPGDRPPPDGDLIMQAYQRWGKACHRHLFGDWSFAAWHQVARQLTLSRDQCGNTVLYYAHVGDRFAFASDITSLLSLPWVPRRVDEVRLAKLLVDWHRGLAGTTAYLDIHRLAPAHFLDVTQDGPQLSPYSPFEVAEITLSSDDEYAEALREVVRSAVDSRLRALGPVGTTVSAGLDSSAVTTLAAEAMGRRSQRLTAMTSVPGYSGFPKDRSGVTFDEGPGAALVASRQSNIDLILVPAMNITPIHGLRHRLRVLHVPVGGARNAFWLWAILDVARRRSLRALLTGQLGNFVFSWLGPRRSWFSLIQNAQFRTAASRLAPRWLRTLRQIGWQPSRLREAPWRSFSALNMEFARECQLLDLMREHGHDPRLFQHAPDSRQSQLLNAAGATGPAWARLGTEFGVDVRDPFQDVRVVTFALSVPERLWQGPQPRWLARQSMRGVLPEAVRLSGRRGLQAADVCRRLADHPQELEAAFAEVEASPLARRVVDLPHCRQVAARLPTSDASDFVGPLVAADTILLRGLEVALFLAGVDRGDPPLTTPTDRLAKMEASAP